MDRSKQHFGELVQSEEARDCMIRREIFALIIIIASCVFVTACNKPSTPPSAEPVVVQEPDIEHTVRYPGETLAVISKWYTGRATNWNAIMDNNPGLRPERINLGQMIMIPRALVVEERPMPRDFVKSVSTSKSAVTESVDSAPEVAPTQERPTDEVSSSSEASSEMEASAPSPTAAQIEPSSEPVIEPTSSSSSAASSVTDDKEREKLLDELLQQ